ncbi:MAG TPA: hypothetical protein VFP84_06570 [Kofleriaceae bacterium]|nr:hypothetical protein [Kofleriaceae bacterium]
MAWIVGVDLVELPELGAAGGRRRADRARANSGAAASVAPAPAAGRGAIAGVDLVERASLGR